MKFFTYTHCWTLPPPYFVLDFPSSLQPFWTMSHRPTFRYKFEDLIPPFDKRLRPSIPVFTTLKSCLLTTFGLVHALNFDTSQLDAELRGTTTFRDPRLPSIRPPALGSHSTRRPTTTSLTPDDDTTLTTRTSSTTRPTRGFVVATSDRPLSPAEIRATMNRSRSRSRPRLNPRDISLSTGPP